jgi:hypothetical protein
MKTPLEYQLAACLNLERTLIERGWPADAAYFRQRQKEIRRQLQKQNGGAR